MAVSAFYGTGVAVYVVRSGSAGYWVVVYEFSEALPALDRLPSILETATLGLVACIINLFLRQVQRIAISRMSSLKQLYEHHPRRCRT